MSHQKTTVQYFRPDGTGVGAGSGQWTGEKRRKHLELSLPRFSGDVRTSSACSPVQGGQEDPFSTIAETDLGSFVDEIKAEQLIDIMKFLRKKDRNFIVRRGILEEQDQRDVYERHLLYRLRYQKLSKMEFDKLDNETLRKELDKLDDETLRKELPGFLSTASIFRLHIDMHYYYESLKKDEDGPVDWYFDPDFSKLESLSDYQRLVLTDDGNYLHWEDYRTSFTTYKMDKDYVAFCDIMSKELQCLKSLIGSKGSDEWEKMQTRGANRALMMATEFPEMSLDLVHTAYREYICSLENDYFLREGWDRIFFVIWKLVTEKKLEFAPAVKEVSEMDFVPPRHLAYMVWALKKSTLSDLKSKFDSCVEGIPHSVENDFASKWIAKKVLKVPTMKIMHQYKKRKMEIAQSIRLAQG